MDAHFITHFHSDHLDGLTDLWGTGWLPTPFGSRRSPMVIHGPVGTISLTDNLTKAFAEDIRIRLADEKLPPEGIAFDAHDIGPGVVYDEGGVTVTAFDVDHGELIKPSFGYKIEYDGKTVVISGDTRRDERIAEQAKGADQINAHHTTPEQAGEIFAMAQPKLAACSHIIPLKPGQGLAEAQDTSTIISRTRQTYDGLLVAGADLTTFVIGDDGVTSRTRPVPRSRPTDRPSGASRSTESERAIPCNSLLPRDNLTRVNRKSTKIKRLAAARQRGLSWREGDHYCRVPAPRARSRTTPASQADPRQATIWSGRISASGCS